MKIGILGGTFDPVHKGHIKIAEASLSQFCLDCIWLMPAGNPYFKSKNNITDAKLRLEMTKLSIEELSEKFSVSDFEIKKNGKTYTADTLTELKQLYPEHEFYFILGEDSLSALDSWYRPDIILKNAVILVAGREDEDKKKSLLDTISFLKQKFSDCRPDIRIIECDYIDISSTMIRKRISEGIDCSDILNEKVYNFIKKNKLYLS